MTKRPDTWMPFYVGDYLADTMHLTCEQHGAYLLLIFAYWRTGKPLNDDDAELAAITKNSKFLWRKIRKSMERFFVINSGKWHHKRIDSELQKANDIKDERSKAGAEGAAIRWRDHLKHDGKPMANAMAKPSQNDAPSPSPSQKEDSGTDVPGGEPPIAPDPVKAIWDRGLAILGQKQRGLLGKIIKQYTSPIVLAAIVECEREQPVDAPAYFIACCDRRKANGSRRSHAEQISDLGEWARRTDERESVRGDYEAAD